MHESSSAASSSLCDTAFDGAEVHRLVSADPKYGGDGTRIDLAYAIYAASHGAGEAQIAAAIRSRDLSHKGGEAGKPTMWNAPFKKRSRAPGASRGADKAARDIKESMP